MVESVGFRPVIGGDSVVDAITKVFGDGPLGDLVSNFANDS